MKVKSESEVAQLCPTLRDPMDCSLPGSSVHGIFQARVLEWGAIAFSSTSVYFYPNLDWIPPSFSWQRKCFIPSIPVYSFLSESGFLAFLSVGWGQVTEFWPVKCDYFLASSFWNLPNDPLLCLSWLVDGKHRIHKRTLRSWEMRGPLEEEGRDPE